MSDESGDGYRSREHDHLVEPMFGGLGVEPARARKPSFLARCLAFVRRLWRGWRS
jgi:hypothetical protein